MRTIAIVNQKGGCGKTTTAINLAAIGAKRGMRTLLVDMDPQSHCAAGLGVPDEGIENHIGRALLSDLSRGFSRESLVWEVSRNLDLAPSSMALAGLEAPGGGLHALEDRDRRLTLLLRWLAPHYDRCLIDCPPTIGLLTYNALRAAGEAIIPVETGYFALRGAKKQWETIRNLVDRVNHPITCYVLPTLFDASDRIARNILGAIRRQFGGRVIPLVIRDHSAVREAAGFGQPVIEYAPESEAVSDFAALADWLDDHPADPPEILVDVAKSVTIPWSQEPAHAFVTDRPAALDSTRPVLHEPNAGQMRGLATGESGGSRAAEMAQRMRELVTNRQRGLAPQPMPPSTAMVLRAEAGMPHMKPGSAALDTQRESVTAHAASPVGQSRQILQNHAPESADELAGRRLATVVESKDLPPPVSVIHTNLVRLFGARQTPQGVLFVQPGSPSMSLSVAGVFNGWSPLASPMRYNPESGVFELLLPLPRGEHEYRLVIDGRWQPDPYNTIRRRNGFGEENNIVVVR